MRAGLLALLACGFASTAQAAGIPLQINPLPTGTCAHSVLQDSGGNFIQGSCGGGSGYASLTGNNTYTGNNTFQVDPTISSGGSSTTGAVFFGTNLGTKFLGYNPATGSSGGYSLGGTFTAADTLYVGPVQVNNGTSASVTLTATSGGNWTFTYPSTGGTNGYILTTNGSGTTSWTAPAATGSWSANGNGAYFHGASGGYLIETGGVASSGTSFPNVTITFPSALSSGVTSFTANVISSSGTPYVVTGYACSTTGCTATATNLSGTAVSGLTVTWTIIGS
jgi:hypothetical protein